MRVCLSPSRLKLQPETTNQRPFFQRQNNIVCWFPSNKFSVQMKKHLLSLERLYKNEDPFPTPFSQCGGMTFLPTNIKLDLTQEGDSKMVYWGKVLSFT